MFNGVGDDVLNPFRTLIAKFTGKTRNLPKRLLSFHTTRNPLAVLVPDDYIVHSATAHSTENALQFSNARSTAEMSAKRM